MRKRKNNVLRSQKRTTDKKEMVFEPEQFAWTDELIRGNVLIILGGTMDSFGKKVQPGIRYKIGKHKQNGFAMIVPEDQLHVLESK